MDPMYKKNLKVINRQQSNISFTIQQELFGLTNKKVNNFVEN